MPNVSLKALCFPKGVLSATYVEVHLHCSGRNSRSASRALNRGRIQYYYLPKLRVVSIPSTDKAFSYNSVAPEPWHDNIPYLVLSNLPVASIAPLSTPRENRRGAVTKVCQQD
jgi:hypothetical protein